MLNKDRLHIKKHQLNVRFDDYQRRALAVLEFEHGMSQQKIVRLMLNPEGRLSALLREQYRSLVDEMKQANTAKHNAA